MEERLGEMRKGREDEKGAYDKLELKHQNLVFFKLIECIIIKMSWCETECKNMCHW